MWLVWYSKWKSFQKKKCDICRRKRVMQLKLKLFRGSSEGKPANFREEVKQGTSSGLVAWTSSLWCWIAIPAVFYHGECHKQRGVLVRHLRVENEWREPRVKGKQSSIENGEEATMYPGIDRISFNPQNNSVIKHFYR